MMRSTSPVPTTASTSGTCSRICARNRSTRHPATINFFAAPNFLCSAISKMASTDSFCAASIKLHVFTTNTSRSEEHTSELQSRGHLVCRLLLEKKKNHYSSACESSASSLNHHSES